VEAGETKWYGHVKNGYKRLPRKVLTLKFEGKRTQSLWKTSRRKEQAGRREKR